jgi:hypothetical protein
LGGNKKINQKEINPASFSGVLDPAEKIYFIIIHPRRQSRWGILKGAG